MGIAPRRMELVAGRERRCSPIQDPRPAVRARGEPGWRPRRGRARVLPDERYIARRPWPFRGGSARHIARRPWHFRGRSARYIARRPGHFRGRSARYIAGRPRHFRGDAMLAKSRSAADMRARGEPGGADQPAPGPWFASALRRPAGGRRARRPTVPASLPCGPRRRGVAPAQPHGRCCTSMSARAGASRVPRADLNWPTSQCGLRPPQPRTAALPEPPRAGRAWPVSPEQRRVQWPAPRR
jgi:hypothetical protein